MAIEAKRAAMSPEALKGHLRGALAFPITPYAADGSVDLEGVRANARWLPDSGVCAVVAPSGTGELFALSRTSAPRSRRRRSRRWRGASR